jgi:putative Ca2+/H+ antiporter (TMEM165/GDT1 family)
VSAWTALGGAYLVILLAELGDKSQFAILALASRGHRWRVAAEAVGAFLVLTVLATLVGAVLFESVPRTPLQIAAGLLFLLFGALALLRREEGEEGIPRTHRWGGAFLVVLLSELGDKTQLATAGLAAASDTPLAAGLGAFLALATTTLLAVVAGAWLARHVKPEALRMVAAGLFIGVGLLLVWTALA